MTTSILTALPPSRRKQWQPIPVLLPGKSHEQRSQVDGSPWGQEESDTTEQLHFHFSLSFIGEGNDNPLQCSGLENPRDSGAWWAAVYGVAQSRTRLKRLSNSSSPPSNFFFFLFFFSWREPHPCFYFYFSFIFISWRLVTLQYCSGFCHTLTWISHGFTCVHHPEPPSASIPIPPLPSAPALSTCLMHPTWAGGLFHTW